MFRIQNNARIKCSVLAFFSVFRIREMVVLNYKIFSLIRYCLFRFLTVDLFSTFLQFQKARKRQEGRLKNKTDQLEAFQH